MRHSELLSPRGHHSRPRPGPSTSSLAALSYRLHAELAQEHGGAERWGYRALDTLSVSAYLGGSKGRKLGKEREVFDWLDKGVLAESSVIGTKESTAQVVRLHVSRGEGREELTTTTASVPLHHVPHRSRTGARCQDCLRDRHFPRPDLVRLLRPLRHLSRFARPPLPSRYDRRPRCWTLDGKSGEAATRLDELGKGRANRREQSSFRRPSTRLRTNSPRPSDLHEHQDQQVLERARDLRPSFSPSFRLL